MSNRLRWALAALIVLVGATIALWPRSDGAPGAAPAPARTADLTAARAAAHLAPCPAGAPSPAGALTGVSATCLATGAPVGMADALGADRPVLVNVWASWCEPCRAELPVLAEYAGTPGSARVLGVAVQSPPDGALALLTALHVRFPNVTDDGAVARALRVPDALPASYVIGRDGVVRFVAQPRLLRSVADVRAAVQHYGGGG